MGKWPSRNGLAVSPFEMGFTQPDREDFQYKRTQNHHGYWTRTRYTSSPLLMLFRGLETHVHALKIHEHQGLHERYAPPEVPHAGLMVDVLDEYIEMTGVLNIVREKATNQTREVNLSQWEKVRLTYRTE